MTLSRYLQLILATLWTIPALAQSGSINQAFQTGSGMNDGVRVIALQADQRILIAGDFTAYNGTAQSGICRLMPDGSIDNSFQIGSGLTANGVIGVESILIQSDGKIIIGGCFTHYNGVSRVGIVRLHSNGVIDETFNPGSGFNHPILGQGCIYAMALQSDGKIVVVGGQMNMFNGTSISNIVRLNPDGSLDNTFLSGAGVDGPLFSVAIQPTDDKILIGGYHGVYNGESTDIITRLNTDGSFDNTFNTQGSGFDNSVTCITPTPSGKIWVSGLFTEYDNADNGGVALLNSDGSIDNSFSLNGAGFDDAVWRMSVLSDGKIIAAGYFENYNGNPTEKIARLNQDGTLDMTFNSGVGFDSWVRAVVPQSDGNLIIGGWFTQYNGTPVNRIVGLLNEVEEVSVQESTPLSNIRVWTHQNQIHVHIPDPAKRYGLKLFNPLGQIIKQFETVGESELVISTSGNSTGIHVLQMGTDSNAINHRVLLTQ